MRILSLLLGIAWIGFGIYILIRPESEGPTRVFAAISLIGAGLFCVSYAFSQHEAPDEPE